MADSSFDSLTTPFDSATVAFDATTDVGPVPGSGGGGASSTAGAGFTYLFADLRTNEILAELPLLAPTFALGMSNIVGHFHAEVDLTSPAVRELDPMSATLPGRTAVYIDLDGTLVWGGILWIRNYSRSKRHLVLDGDEFASYLGALPLAQAYSFTTPTDPIVIARTVIADALAEPGADIGLILGAQTSTALTTQDYPANQQQYVGQVLDALARMAPGQGFDYAVDVAYDSDGTPTKTLNFGYPRRGRIAGSTGLVIDFATCTEYEWPEDATQSGNTIIETGTGAGSAQLQSVASNPGLITGGYPRLVKIIGRSQITSQDVLDQVTAGDLALLAEPVTTPTVTIPIKGDPPLGGYLVGDDARIVIDPDPRFPDGLDTYKRIVSAQIMPADEGMSLMKLTLNAPPVF